MTIESTIDDKVDLEISSEQLTDYYSYIPNASEIVSALRIPIRVFDGTAIRLEKAHLHMIKYI